MKPILFNTDMVRSILDNRKTVTRRVVRPQPPEGFTQAQDVSGEWFFNDKLGDNDMMAWWPSYEKGIAPPYIPSDILYVRETWCRQHSEEYPFVYRASVLTPDAWKGLWRPSIHMPREAARIFLRVTDVRVERLRDITIGGVAEEGIPRPTDEDWMSLDLEKEPPAPFCWFAHLWDSTITLVDHSLYSWNANPWVWVIRFERIRKEEAGI